VLRSSYKIQENQKQIRDILFLENVVFNSGKTKAKLCYAWSSAYGSGYYSALI
jgi:hypothetical protein